MDFERLQIALEIARPGAGKAHHGVDARRRCGTGADQFAVEEHAWAAVVVADREMRPARDRHRQREYRSEEHTSELQSLMRISYAVFCLKKKKHEITKTQCNRMKTKT